MFVAMLVRTGGYDFKDSGATKEMWRVMKPGARMSLIVHHFFKKEVREAVGFLPVGLRTRESNYHPE